MARGQSLFFPNEVLRLLSTATRDELGKHPVAGLGRPVTLAVFLAFLRKRPSC